MRSTINLAAQVVSAALVLLPSASAASRSYYTDCGTRQPSILVTAKAHGVGCKVARRVGKKYALNDARHPLRFHCSKPKDLGSGEAFKGTCKRRGAIVKVNFGL